jgi:hypothetical protein
MGGDQHGTTPGLLSLLQVLKAFDVHGSLQIPLASQHGKPAELDHHTAQIGIRPSRQANEFRVAFASEGHRQILEGDLAPNAQDVEGKIAQQRPQEQSGSLSHPG